MGVEQISAYYMVSMWFQQIKSFYWINKENLLSPQWLSVLSSIKIPYKVNKENLLSPQWLNTLKQNLIRLQ